MAKPDTDDGWFKLAYELDAALCYADFSSLAQTILRLIRAQLYGKGKRAVARLAVAEVVVRTGQKAPNVHRAFRELIDSGALIGAEADGFRFVKDYEKWTRRERHRDFDSPKVPRLTPAEVADCKAAPSYAKGSQSRPAELYPNGYDSVSERIVDPIRTDTNPYPNGYDSVSERIQSHIDEAPASDSGRMEKLRSKQDAPESAPIPRTKTQPSEPPPPPKPMATGPDPVIVNRPPASEPIRNAPAEVDRAAAYAKATWGDRAECEARADCEDFWAVDVLEAMKKAKSAGAAGYGYAAKVVRSWWTETGGRPKNTPAAKLKAAPMHPSDRRDGPLTETDRHILRRMGELDRARIAKFQASCRGTAPLDRTA
jgi:hypothetical protein